MKSSGGRRAPPPGCSGATVQTRSAGTLAANLLRLKATAVKKNRSVYALRATPDRKAAKRGTTEYSEGHRDSEGRYRCRLS